MTAEKTAQEVFSEEETKKKVGEKFDFKDYQISTLPEAREVKIADTGDSFEVKVKPLSWARRNQILSKSVKFGTDGNTSFDGDVYVRMCLREMVVEAPWGKTTETFLLSIDDRLGTALEDIVPKAFNADDEGGLGQVDNLKDGS